MNYYTSSQTEDKPQGTTNRN